MTNANNDVRELEDLLTELEGQGALPAGPYSDEDDAVTQLMDAPLGAEEWMVQITPLDRRMMSTDQLIAEIATGSLVKRDMLVWRAGMSDWAPIARIDELTSPALGAPAPMLSERRPLPPPPTPVPPPRLPSTTMVSPVASPMNGVSPNGVASNGVLANGTARGPLPPIPSTPFAAPKLTPVPDVPPPAPLPLLNSAFGSAGAPPIPSSALPTPVPSPSFNVPPPAAAPNLPAPTMRTNTPRPVAVDFSEIEPVRSTPIKILIGSGVAAVAMIIGTVYALSAGGVFDANAEANREPVATASKPAASAPAAPMAAKPAEPKPVMKPAEAKPAEVASDSAGAGKDESDGKNEPQTQPVSTKEEMVAEPERKGSKAKSKQELKAKDEPAAKGEAAPSAETSKPEQASERSDEEASDPPRGSRAERRLAARLRKRATAEETAAPRRSKPSAAAVATTETAETDDAKGADAPGSTFNKQAAKTALDDAAAQARNCRPQGGPSGSGKVQVRYEPTGKVGAVSILTPQFDNTTTGSCVVMVFRRASIPAFTGSPPVVMNKNFEIP
jgi:hypothetical protein